MQSGPLTRAGSTALLTDHYELTMLDAAVASGAVDHPAVFEVFARRLPPGRAYGVVGGQARLLDAIARFRFGAEELDYLASRRFLAPGTLRWLGDFRFSGTLTGYREGELFFPASPILTAEGTFGETLILETLILSILNFDSAVAAAASRIVSAAAGTPLIEMGGRRVHEYAAVAAARMACAIGFASTSNLEAGRLWGTPTAGTAAHAFTLAHGDEREAFTAQIARLGVETTLLVDTYDTASGIRAAVDVARTFGAAGPGAVRLDSGDLLEEARRARHLLDSLGAGATSIVVSGDLDEYSIAGLEGAAGGRAPIDAYGVGTRVTTGSGAPTAEFVYKLVAVGSDAGGAPHPVAKRSVAKETVGGRKWAARVLDADGRAVGERLSWAPEALDGRPLQVDLVVAGEPRPQPSLTEITSHHRAALAELGPAGLELDAPGPALAVVLPSGGPVGGPRLA